MRQTRGWSEKWAEHAAVAAWCLVSAAVLVLTASCVGVAY